MLDQNGRYNSLKSGVGSLIPFIIYHYIIRIRVTLRSFRLFFLVYASHGVNLPMRFAINPCANLLFVKLIKLFRHQDGHRTQKLLNLVTVVHFPLYTTLTSELLRYLSPAVIYIRNQFFTLVVISSRKVNHLEPIFYFFFFFPSRVGNNEVSRRNETELELHDAIGSRPRRHRNLRNSPLDLRKRDSIYDSPFFYIFYIIHSNEFDSADGTENIDRNGSLGTTGGDGGGRNTRVHVSACTYARAFHWASIERRKCPV